MKLKGQRALVTGASRGIGRAIATTLAAEGAAVLASGRSTAELDALRNEIETAGGVCHVASVDLAEAGGVARLWDSCMRHWDGLDILVNNAGVGSSTNPRPVVDFDDDFWNLTLWVNLTAPYLLTKYALPGMLEHQYGRIVNVASIAGKVGTVHGAAYAASKHGLLGFTRSLALEVARDGSTVNAICPGPVRSLMNDKRIAYDAQRLGKTFAAVEASSTPIGRRLEPAEIAPWAVYLASPEASAVTGQAYNIDGGLLML